MKGDGLAGDHFVDELMGLDFGIRPAEMKETLNRI